MTADDLAGVVVVEYLGRAANGDGRFAARRGRVAGGDRVLGRHRGTGTQCNTAFAERIAGLADGHRIGLGGECADVLGRVAATDDLQMLADVVSRVWWRGGVVLRCGVGGAGLAGRACRFWRRCGGVCSCQTTGQKQEGEHGACQRPPRWWCDAGSATGGAGSGEAGAVLARYMVRQKAHRCPQNVVGGATGADQTPRHPPVDAELCRRTRSAPKTCHADPGLSPNDDCIHSPPM